MLPPVRLVRLLRVSKRGRVERNCVWSTRRCMTGFCMNVKTPIWTCRSRRPPSTYCTSSFRPDTRKRHLSPVEDGRLTRAFLHALLRCADHFNSTRLRLTSNALSIRTTERHITVGWCKEVSRDVLFSTYLITAISATSTKTASPSFRAVSWRRLSPVFSKHLLFTALTVCTIQIWTM